ncbi:Cell surface mannoprotein mp65 [Exophiala dermatitidis]|uniref:Cell wall glucanase (Scw4) n=2 Tax=Exophiala dermatitidis TaxID=5970 RepID=H6C1J7_EXODN|nr:cell wall glucanase (Scw4) [Exophiala dermatitidis NIH/UT8656]KAJ4507264.1 Cell surface mannoprotein mp65 [Exophiala dermatitidis]EHY58587.1 cell wall glucanase (Scw4) [Exophiala dermatitidis NIH/UT8656]KAJ4509239.1 Cell surface mannoprotein mp65 [Exophiala dermatitidis]KAJ4509426.1 Cell surface mannoprotein mp65 [Exophiala dermatitidis]KAJ4530418.1 Cell surface mannoprotein mp65 [Exophiala dermatitidis]
MKALVFGLAAVCAQVGLAVPHGPGQQQHHHHVRHAVTDYSTVTDIVTVTAPNAVVWVDQYNNIISTEYRDIPIASATATNTLVISTPVPVAVVPVSSNTVVVPSSQTYNVPTAAASSSYESSAVASSVPISSAPAAVSSVIVPDSSSTAVVSSAPSTQAASTSGSGTGGDKLAHHADGSSADYSGFGICYELIGDSGCKDQTSLNSDFGFLASQGFTKVRTYDIGCDLGVVAAAAASQGLQLIIGLNGIGNVASDLAKLVGMINGNWAPIDTVVIGNEVVNDGGSAAAVVAALAVARPILAAAGFSKNVVAVDTFMAHQQNPSICANSDYCAVNAHAFFDPNTSAPNAGSFVINAASEVASIAGGKQVIITESGWPWQGSPDSLAIPSPANQVSAIASLKTSFSSNPGSLFLFQAFDATYKAPGPFGVEQYFGIFGH